MKIKNTEKFFLYPILLLLIFSCREPVQNCDTIDTKALIFINRTAYKKTAAKKTVIRDTLFLQNMCALLFEKRKRITDVNVRDNKGFVEVLFEKNEYMYFEMIYTDYDGTVFRLSTNQYYKNDELVELLESELMLPD